MASNSRELVEIERYLRGEVDVLTDGVLKRIELGFWVSGPDYYSPSPSKFGVLVYELTASSFGPKRVDEALLLCGRFGPSLSLQMLSLFRLREPTSASRFLLVRVKSWSCYLNCDGDILSEHCEENLDAMRDACEKLRQRCAARRP
jgi:hypothetical protein